MADEEIVPETKTGEDLEEAAPSLEKKPVRTKAETTAFNLKKQADEARALGLDPAEILGVKSKDEPKEDADDDTPVTVGMLKERDRQTATKSALQMAQEIADEDTRSLVTEYLQHNIVPSGNAEQDFRIALAAAAAPKNKQVLDEINRYGTPKRGTAGGSLPAKTDAEFVPTDAERNLVAGFGFSPEKQKEIILKSRKQEADKKG